MHSPALLRCVYLALLLLIGLSSCTRFNLAEQFPPEGRQVPVILPDTHQATFYEKDGKFYRALSVAMATENVPLLSSRLRRQMAPYAGTTTYTPIPHTDSLYLFQLTDDEADLLQQTIRARKRQAVLLNGEPIDEEEPRKEVPPMFRAADFDLSGSRRHTLPLGNHFSAIPRLPREIQFPTATRTDDCEYPAWNLPDNEPRPTAALPVQAGTRSMSKTLLMVPVWTADAAGNLLLGCAEGAIAAPLSVISLPILGIMYLCGAELP